MNYSYFHEDFAAYLYLFHYINEQDVLDHPENYLGPNYKEVLNLWFYKESLSDDQLAIYDKRGDSLDHETWHKARNIAEDLAREVIDPRFVGEGLFDEDVLELITDEDVLELITSHLYIERGISFTFLPLIFDL